MSHLLGFLWVALLLLLVNPPTLVQASPTQRRGRTIVLANHEGLAAMRDDLIIRPETPADWSAITEVTVAAFRTLAISQHTEQFIIAALRAAQALTISLVAEAEGRVVGHIAFSR